MRYPVCGTATKAISSVTDGAVNLLGAGITAGRSLFLRHFWAYNSIAQAHVILIDATAAVLTGPTAANKTHAADGQKFVAEVVSGCSGNNINNPFTVEFAPPGLKFSTGCVVGCNLTTSGITLCGGAGYEE